ncbi:MAG: DUF2092 domain-containing protein [Proteobacteria bacterium]|nr:DUF2092 domain-containing protein [Pseudomonadota bacterium]
MKRVLFCLAAAILALPGIAHAQTPPAAPPKSEAPAAERHPIEPKAMDILKASCRTLAGAKAMSFHALNTYEKAARNGQPLYYATLNLVTFMRPNMLRVVTPGDGVPDEFYYDGKAMMAYVPSEDLVAIAEAPPTVDAMLNTAWEKAAVYFPFADMIVADPCEVFERRGLESAFYVGQSKVIGGTVTDMVAIAGRNVQAELWIGAADHLPRLVRVVYPHEPAHALYQTEYSNWHLLEKVDPAMFTSAKAANAKKMPFAPPGADQKRPDPPAKK